MSKLVLPSSKLFACWVIVHAFLSSVDFFQFFFSKESFRNTIRVSNRLDPDQARRFVGPDLGPNCLQRFSADERQKSPLAGKDVKGICSKRKQKKKH